MTEIKYLDFDLLIARTGDGYVARVLNSPAGQAAVGFRLPFSTLELENFLLRVGRTRRGVRRLESPEMQAAKAFGGRLFKAVFGGEVRGCLRSSLDEASRQGAGVRVRLRLAEVPELADVPWEYLYNPALNRFMVLSVETPLVRYLDLPERIRPLAVKPPLKVLVMISCPSDYPQLDVEQEWTRLREALGDLEHRGLVALERLENATLVALQRRLRRGVYHVFHFVGHGGFDRQAQDGVLLLEDERGQGRSVSGQYLGTLLHDERTLRLAILNACEGAWTSRADPFAGTAQSLVLQGIPAVIAMQFEITDDAAITLAHEFYGALADGYPVDAALAESRKAIFAQENDVEWGTPVLYMRAPDGRIFDVAQVGPAETRLPSVAPEVDRELEQRLERLYTAALSAFWLEEWERACRSFQSIVDVRPDYQDAAAKLEEAQRQRKLNALYAQVQAAREGEDWQAALSALEELVAEAPDFKDAAALVEAARRQRQLADLYAEARRLHQAQQWQAVVNVFAQIGAVEPDYPDPEDLLPTAEQEFAALKRQAELDELYGRAVRRMDDGRWHEAQQLLAQVQEMEPGFREAERLLSRAEAEIAREDAEQERREQIATLYEQAVGLVRARQWRQALAKMDEIRALDPQFADLEGIAARAQEEVAWEEEEARRQNELAALYAEAVQLLRAGQYQKALEKWGEVRDRDPRYSDRQNVQSTARKKLAALTETAPPKRGSSRRALLVGGGVVILVVVLAFALIVLPGLPFRAGHTPRPADPWGEVVVRPGGTVNLAFVGALSGDLARFGEVQKKAFLMAIEDLATVKGFPIAASVIADGGCGDGNIGQRAANTIVSDENIVGVIGHGCSYSCRAGASVYEEAHVVMISPSCTGSDLTERGFVVFNRVATRDDWDRDDAQVVTTSVYQEFANRYEDRYDPPPGVPWGEGDLDFYAAYAYDAAGILIRSIEQVAVVDASGDLIIGRQALARAVRATSGYQGVTGIISFDGRGDRLP